MTEFNYARVLTRCMAISALALMGGVFFPIPSLVSFSGALAPLIWYHLFYLRPKAGEGLGPAAIDSVYYYGFLVTVGALGATTLDLSINGFGGDFAVVAFQFGLGLLATGYAVWARVHLTASAKLLDQEELAEIMNKYIEESRQLVTNVSMASAEFASFAQTLIEKSSSFAARMESQTKSSIEEATKAFGLAVGAMAEEAKLALADLRGAVTDVTFGGERDELRKSVTSMIKTVASLSSGLEQLQTSTRAGAGSVGEFAGSLGAVNQHASAAAANLERLGKADGTVAKFDEALAAGIAKTRELAMCADVASASITGMSDKSSSTFTALQSVEKRSVEISAGLGEIAGGLEGVSSIADRVKAAAQSLATLQSGASESTAGLELMRERVMELYANLENLNAALIDSTGGLKDSLSEAAESIELSAQRFFLAAEQKAAPVKADELTLNVIAES